MSRIIAFGGKKQSGKSTSCNYLGGLLLTAFHKIPDFIIDEDGRIVVSGNSAPVDINTISPDIVKVYSFAEYLKEFCVKALGVDPAQVYGNDFQKNHPTDILWQNIPGCVTNKSLYNYLVKSAKRKSDLFSDYRGSVNIFYHKPGYMTGREVMQHFGTEIVRSINDGAWRNYTINRIAEENPLYAFISDLRFEDEFAAIKDAGGYCIKLLRGSSKDSHSSEKGLDKIPDDYWDIIIDNTSHSMNDLKKALVERTKSKNLLKPEFLN